MFIKPHLFCIHAAPTRSIADAGECRHFMSRIEEQSRKTKKIVDAQQTFALDDSQQTHQVEQLVTVTRRVIVILIDYIRAVLVLTRCSGRSTAAPRMQLISMIRILLFQNRKRKGKGGHKRRRCCNPSKANLEMPLKPLHFPLHTANT